MMGIPPISMSYGYGSHDRGDDFPLPGLGGSNEVDFNTVPPSHVNKGVSPALLHILETARGPFDDLSYINSQPGRGEVY